MYFVKLTELGYNASWLWEKKVYIPDFIRDGLGIQQKLCFTHNHSKHQTLQGKVK